MTPRQADVAFVLEGVPGVRAVYAVAPRAARHADFAIALDNTQAMAAAHYALLRVMTNEECARVRMFVGDLPAVTSGASELTLDHGTREDARARVPPPKPRPRADVAASHVLVLDGEPATARVLEDALGSGLRYHVTSDLTEAVNLATSSYAWALMVVDGKRAFGTNGFLARVPLELARRVFVLVDVAGLPDARWRLQGSERVIVRPLAPAQAWRAFEAATPSATQSRPAPPPELPVAARAPRAVTAPPPSKPLRVLLVDVEGEFDVAFGPFGPFGRELGGEIELVVKTPIDDAIEYAFANPVSVMICGARPALAKRSFIDGIAREDPAAGRRIIVAVNARDVVRVRAELASRWRRNRVLALPVEEASLRAAVLRSHPELALRALPPNDAIPKVRRPAYRRLAALVVDDDASTQILFSSGVQVDDADVALETTSLAAFEHVLSRPVDVLFVSAAMRTDGGEPFYRSLWRMKPELRPRTVLITSADAAPPSARGTKLPRVLERPASRSRIAEILAAFRQATSQAIR